MRKLLGIFSSGYVFSFLFKNQKNKEKLKIFILNLNWILLYNKFNLRLTEIITNGFILVCTIFVLIRMFPALIIGSVYIVGIIGVIILLLTIYLYNGLNG